MIRRFKMSYIVLLFAIFFMIPCGFLVSEIINNKGYDYSDILTYGVETDAYVIAGSESSSIIVNDVHYWSIAYEFKDENSITYKGRTSESYTGYQIQQMIDNKVIKIKYLPDTFESIEANYDVSKDKDMSMIVIFSVIFVIADIVLWIIAIYIMKYNSLMKKIELQGTEYTAHVVGISSDLVENGVSKYKVHYNWQNDKGEKISSSTKSIYYYEEALVLEKLKLITIKAIGNKSIITTFPDMTLLENPNNFPYGSIQESMSMTCEYCGNSIKADEQRCSNCGAKIINRK